MTKFTVVKDAVNPEPKEVLAAAIIKIGEAADSLRKSGLNEEAITILLHAKTNVPKRDIKLILDGLRRLRGWYCHSSPKGLA
jgi:hypothetical protein